MIFLLFCKIFSRKSSLLLTMRYVDLHTHRKGDNKYNAQGTRYSVVNCAPTDELDGVRYCSVGIHPWDVAEGWREDFERLKERVLLPQVVAIGECGLDKLRGGEWSLQMECFQAQIDLARRVGKPLILHCVKAVDEVMRMCVGVKCVFHGFRGKPELAKQLLGRGFDLSFGERFNVESLALAWQAGRMWLETDESELGIEEIYERAARALRISPTDIVVPGTVSW